MDGKYGESLDHWHDSKPDTSDAEVNLSKSHVADVLYQESLRLIDEKRYGDALALIDVAIENSQNHFEYHKTRGLILENLARYSESLQSYERALELKGSDEIKEDKARMLYRWANSLNDKNKALELINKAIEALPESAKDTYFEKFWYLRGSIFDCLGQPIESRRCYLIAEGMSDEAAELERQADLLKNSKDTLITIAGTRFYFGLEPFKKGSALSLVKESDNEHDPDAIRVEMEGETVGYVANNDYTLIENVKSASEIKSLNPSKAEVMMIYMEEYVIARLVD